MTPKIYTTHMKEETNAIIIKNNFCIIYRQGIRTLNIKEANNSNKILQLQT